MNYPLVTEISYQAPHAVFALFQKEDGVVLLESAEMREGCGRYSFIAVDPFLRLISKNGEIRLNDEVTQDDPFDVLQRELVKYPMFTHPELPPFQGGVAGFFGYELHQHLEAIVQARIDDMQFPDMGVGFYDLVIAFDHQSQRAWIFASGYPVMASVAREARAMQRTQWLQKRLNVKPREPLGSEVVCDADDIETNIRAADYQEAVNRVIEYILDGDIFEANISQRFKTILPASLAPYDLYLRLRLLNPAPFAAYVNFAGTVLVSASPERFLKLKDKHVEARPIKGTAPRGATPELDALSAKYLKMSAKDQAENVMIVDLLRNDLSRVSLDHSVKVTALCQLESYANVHHLVSVITSELVAQCDAIDLLRATFPGGSITGAPKVRAMEVIAEIEPTVRGPYCGSIGYIGFHGDMDCSVTIRTFAIKDGVVTFQAGGAVVADSRAHLEYEETMTKARTLMMALTTT